MSKRKSVVHLFIVAAVLVIIAAGYAMMSEASGVYAYTTEKYDVSVKANKDYTFDYTEKITVNFDYPQHGIFRYIPTDRNYRIKKIKVRNDKYDVSTESGDKVIKIGSADKTITGRHTYEITYRLVFVKDNDVYKDLLYLDLFPTGWQTSVDRLSLHLELPEDFDMSDISIAAGAYGSEDKFDSYENASVKIDKNKHTLDLKCRNFPSYEGITVYKELPDGYWSPTINNAWTRYVVGLMLLLSSLYIVIKRLTVGRDPRIVQTVEFYPPEDLTPLDIGYVIDGSVDQKDITSMFFYLASKGYIKIHEKSKKVFRFERTKIMDPNERPSIRKFYQGIFGSKAYMNQNAPMIRNSGSEMGRRLGKAYDAIPALVEMEFQGDRALYNEKSIRAEGIGILLYCLTTGVIMAMDMIYIGEAGIEIFLPIFLSLGGMGVSMAIMLLIRRLYSRRNSRKKGATVLLMVLAFILHLIVAFSFVSIVLGMPDTGFDSDILAAAAAVFYILAPLMLLGMKARTAENARLYGQILGFRHFIKTAELDKLNMLVEENPDYFYDVLPYAYVMGLTKKWASNFEQIQVSNPDWYVPVDGSYASMHNFNVVTMNSMFNHVSNTISSEISRSRDTGGGGGGGFSSGGGGGGFSGGGGGGGGGGAW